MPQGKFFHIFWSIFTTQISAYHFHISERWNESILFLKGSSPPLPCHFLWAAELLWVMDGCEMFLCNADREPILFYASVRTNTAASTLSEQLPSILVYWNKQKKKKKNVPRHICKDSVSLVESAKDAEAQAQNLSGVTGTLLRSKFRKVYFTFLSPGPEVWRPNTI